MPWQHQIIDRRQLYDEVWAEPVVWVARRYGITNTALAKICLKLDVPVPPRGYWSRIDAGQALEPDPLFPPGRNRPTSYRIRRWVRAIEQERPAEEILPPLEREEKRERIVVPASVAELHPLVREHEPMLRAARQPLKDKFFLEHACLDVRGTGDAFERALRTMSTLFSALDARGFPVEVTKPNPVAVDGRGHSIKSPSVTGAHVLEVFVTFRIEELFEAAAGEEKVDEGSAPEAPSTRGGRAPKRRPTGRLALKITNVHRDAKRETWAEGKRQRIEEMLNSFIRGLVATAANKRAKVVAEERAAEARRLEAQRRAEEEHQREKIEEMRTDLRRRIDARRYAEEIRGLVQAVEDAAQARGECVAHETDLGRWIEWARGEALRVERKLLEVGGESRSPCTAAPP